MRRSELRRRGESTGLKPVNLNMCTKVVQTWSEPTVSPETPGVEQLVWNLLSNAATFTPEGGIVRLRLDEWDSCRDSLQANFWTPAEAGFHKQFGTF
jgi:signal transduction histidine kinase